MFKGIVPNPDMLLEINGSVVSMIWGEPISPLKYWSISHSPKYLLEVGIIPYYNSIHRIDLVNARFSETSSGLSFQKFSRRHLSGLPVLKYDSDELYVREDIKFTIEFNDYSLNIFIGEVTSDFPLLVVAGKVNFGFDEKNLLRGISISELSPEEIELIKFTFMDIL